MSKSCILHVDDDHDDRLLLRHASKQAGLGLPLLSLENGEQAIAYLSGQGEYRDRNEFPLPCVILLDVKMNGVSGFDVLHWIRSQPDLHDLVVIMFSGSRMEGDLGKAARLGANSFVSKPADCRVLSKLVRAIQDYWLAFHEFGWDSNCRPKQTATISQ
jgi:CheY-like chemotaxis protein